MAAKDLGPLDWRTPIVDGAGRPSPEFQRRWNTQRNNNSGFGTVQSVSATAQAPLSVKVGGTPQAPVLNFTYVAQAANLVFCGPSSGAAASPAFRSLVPADLPGFTAAAAGIVPASGGGTANFLRADGQWAAPPGQNYSVFTSSANGLAPASGGGTANFLRADGQWAAPTGGGGGSGGPIFWNLGAATLTPPTVSTFSLVQATGVGGAGSVASNSSALTLSVPSTSNSDNVCLLEMPAPAGHWTATAVILVTMPTWGCGIEVRDNAGKMIVFGPLNNTNLNGSASFQTLYWKWTNINSFSASVAVPGRGGAGAPIWLRLQNNGTNFVFSTSLDGVNFSVVFTKPLTDFLGSTLSTIGLMLNNNTLTAAGPTGYLDVLHWSVTTP